MSLGAYGKYLAQHKGFMRKMGVDYERKHTHTGTLLTLKRVERKATTDG